MLRDNLGDGDRRKRRVFALRYSGYRVRQARFGLHLS